MVGNFTLNNLLTYGDRKLVGLQWLRGLASFILICTIGALANVGVASYLYRADTYWMLSGLAGIAVGTVWNYGVSGFYTWKS